MTDEEIIALYIARDENAIKATEAHYGRYCYAIAYAILCDRSDAEEIVNDTYRKAWDSIPPEMPNPLKGFLGHVTRQLSLNRLDYHTAKKRMSELPLLLDELSECLSDGDEGKETEESVALNELISRFLWSQDEEARHVFIRRYWYLDSISDLAKRFSVSESKVKSLLFRTRKKLKVFLWAEGYAI